MLTVIFQRNHKMDLKEREMLLSINNHKVSIHQNYNITSDLLEWL